MNPLGCSICFSHKRGSVAFIWFSEGLGTPQLQYFSGNNQRAENSCLLTCSGCHGWQLSAASSKWLGPLPEPLRDKLGLALGLPPGNGPEEAKVVSRSCFQHLLSVRYLPQDHISSSKRPQLPHTQAPWQKPLFR